MTNFITFAEAQALLRAHPKASTRDIACTLKPGKYEYTERMHAHLVGAGIDPAQALTLPQKQVKRFCQFVGALVHRDIKNFDYTHARVLLAMREAGEKNLARDAIVALAASIISPSANTRGITRAQINALFSSRHNVSTVETKVSNSTGKNGFYQVLGMTYGKPGQQNREFSLNKNHPLVSLFYNVIDNATEGQLVEMVSDKEGE